MVICAYICRHLDILLDRALWRRALPAVLVVQCLGATALLAADELRLQPGDTVRIMVDGLPASGIEAQVAPEGILRLGWFGTYVAKDRTLAEVQAEVQSRAASQVLKRYTNDGDLKIIKPRSEDIFLDIVAYRPVTIGGDVAAPGEFPFRAGMTLRSLLALARGAQTGPELDGRALDPMQLTRLQTEYNNAVLNLAISRLEFWRLSAEISEDFDAQPPSSSDIGVSDELAEGLVPDQLRLLSAAEKTVEGQREFLSRALDQAVGRVAILKEQRAKLRESLAADEEEEARIRELLESGLTMASRNSDARRATILTATRLLDVEANLAQAELGVTRMTRDKEEYEQERVRDLTIRREDARAGILSARMQLDVTARLLSSGLIGSPFASAAVEPEVHYALYRDVGDGVRQLPVEMDTLLMPGDIIEVDILPLTGALPTQ